MLITLYKLNVNIVVTNENVRRLNEIWHLPILIFSIKIMDEISKLLSDSEIIL